MLGKAARGSFLHMHLHTPKLPCVVPNQNLSWNLLANYKPECMSYYETTLQRAARRRHGLEWRQQEPVSASYVLVTNISPILLKCHVLVKHRTPFEPWLLLLVLLVALILAPYRDKAHVT